MVTGCFTVGITDGSTHLFFSGCPKQSEMGYTRENDNTSVVSSAAVYLLYYHSVPDPFPVFFCCRELALGDCLCT